jgi:hypothetical protein
MGVLRDGITGAAYQEYLDSDDGGKPTPDQLDAYFQASGLFADYASADSHSQKNWCGFFATYCMKSAGLSTPHWLPGQGIVGNPMEIQKQWGYAGVQPGDVAILAHNSHHIVIYEVGPDYIVDIEGNGDPPPDQQYLGGVITTKRRDITAITAYYQIQE